MNNQLNILPSNKVGSGYVSLEREFSREAISSGLGSLAGKKVLFRTDFSKESIPLQSFSQGTSHSIKYMIKEFSSCPRTRTIASIDSSCALIGETEEGSIYAARVATVFSRGGAIQRYSRAGPVIFYLEPSMIQRGLGSTISKKIINLILLERSTAERFIRMYMERKAQIEAASLVSDSIIVVDGALRTSILEQRNCTLGHLQDVCEANDNQLLGFSKASSLRLVSNGAGYLQSQPRSQIFIDLTEFIRALLPGIGSNNKVAVAKFAANSTVFRLDFSSSNIEEESQLLSDLKYNDSFFRGYPETLRLAHHLSVFDSSTVSSIRGFLSKKYGLVQIPSDDLRATILGKFV